MMKHEFEERVGEKVDYDTYKDIIEIVYGYHPSIKDVGGKDQIAKIYMSENGMQKIKDMWDLANSIYMVESHIHKINLEKHDEFKVLDQPIREYDQVMIAKRIEMSELKKQMEQLQKQMDIVASEKQEIIEKQQEIDKTNAPKKAKIEKEYTERIEIFHRERLRLIKNEC